MSFKALSEAVVGLCNKALGELVAYNPSVGDSVEIYGVFDYAYIEVDGVQSKKPILRIALSDLENEPGKGDTVTIDEVEYRVVESHPDGYGGTTLILKV